MPAQVASLQKYMESMDTYLDDGTLEMDMEGFFIVPKAHSRMWYLKQFEVRHAQYCITKLEERSPASPFLQTSSKFHWVSYEATRG